MSERSENLHRVDNSRGSERYVEVLLSLVRDLVTEFHPGMVDPQSITLDSKFDKELGLDSLSRVELIQRLEKTFSVRLEDKIFAQANCAQDLLKALIERHGKLDGLDTRIIEYEPLPAVERLPQHAATLIEVLEWHQQHHPRRKHITRYRDRVENETANDSISFERLAKRSYQVAWGLLDKGLKIGTKTTIMLPTSSDYFFSFMGVIAAGGIAVPIYPPVRMDQIESYIQRHKTILANSKAEIMITTAEAKRYAALIKSLIPNLRQVVCVEDFTDYPQHATRINLKSDDVAFIQYTSGSTSDPKGVQLTHANLLANIRAMGKAVSLQSDDILISWLPLYHDMGLIGMWLGSFYHASYLVIMSPLEFLLRPHRWLWAIHRYRATISAAPNFAYDLCLHKISDEEIQGLDLSCWRMALNGAEPVIPNVIRRFCQRFAAYGFEEKSMWPVYGLAESSVGLAFPHPDKTPRFDKIKRQTFIETGLATLANENDANALEFVACGQAIAGHEIRVVDDMGFELPDRQEGHLQFKGPSSTIGYYCNPEPNKLLFKGDWLDSGDLAYLDKGVLFLTGRTKDIIIRGGRNIYPQELEEVIGYIDGIRRGRVVVFGYRDDLDGQEKLVVLVEKQANTKQPDALLKQDIISACSSIIDLPPDDIVLAKPNTILKTSSGKLKRSACKNLYLKGQLHQGSGSVWWQIIRLFFSALKQQLPRQWQNLRSLAYAAYCWLIFLLLATFTLFLFQFPLSHRFAQNLAKRLVKTLALFTTTDLKVSGLEFIPANQPCILVANHASYLDAYALIAALPASFRFVAKAELSKNPLIKNALKKLDVIFVDRFDITQSVADLKAIKKTDDTLLFFPEGTFQRTPGLSDFHLGAFVVAINDNKPVVPISIRGTREMLRSGSWFPRKTKIEVQFHPPVQPELGQGDKWQQANQLKETARNVILNACREPDLRG